jgi:hypothetical protein
MLLMQSTKYKCLCKLPLPPNPYFLGSSFHPLSQLKMQRRRSWTGPSRLHLPVERRESFSNPIIHAATNISTNHTDAVPRSQRFQTVEDVDGTGPHLLPRSPAKIRQLRSGIISWVLMVLFSAFVSQYVYQVLIADHPHVGRLFLSPADTNLLITVLSQVFGQLIQALFKNIFDVLRWQLASRERGITIPTFLQLSGATKWLGVLTLTAIKGSHHIWGLHRY